VLNQKGDGGAAYVVLTDLQLEDSLVIDCDARGSGFGTGWAGGVMGILHSDLGIIGTTFARNSAGRFGGAMVVQGANIGMSDSQFFANVLDSEVYGGAMFSATDDGRGISATGTVSNCLFADHEGVTIFDDDRNDPQLPINDIQYFNNDFWVDPAGGPVYRSALSGQKNAAALNALVIDRLPGLPDTDKGSGNVDLNHEPEVAELRAAPIDASAPLAGGGATAPLAWAGGGANVYLDGSAVAQTGVIDAAAGGHSLVVGSASDAQVIGSRPQPGLVFDAGSVHIPIGGSTTLDWQVLNGTFESGFIDRGVGPATSPVGSIQVSPDATTTYRFVGVTREGAVSGEVTVFVGETLIFADDFESGSTAAWSATNS
jgi:hypothetical protein